MSERLGQRLRAYAQKDGRGYPDWALRYVPVVRELQRYGLVGKRVLEIGANENGLARFAPVRTVAVDLDLEHLRAARDAQGARVVQADIAALPFRDGSIDVCVSMDTLEHVPLEARARAAREIVRILARHGVAAVAFPSGEGAARAEEAVQQAYHAFTGRTLSWLDEHARHGLPDAADVARAFTDAAGPHRRVRQEKNAPLWVWRWTWRILMCGWPGRANAVFQALLRLLTPLLCRVHVGRCYRAVIWVEPTTDPSDPPTE